MIRQHLVPKSLQGERYFRWRGGDVSRIEALSDAVFALALTLLIVSLEVPSTYGELIAAFEQIPAFAACAAILIMCWFFHYQYHRRYGFEDFVTVLLNSALLFLILIYVYPLKFLFSILFEQILGAGDTLARSIEAGRPAIVSAQMPTLMITYSAGFAAIFAIFALMNLRAFAKREALGLDRCEILITLLALRSHLISVAVGAVSILLVLISRDLVPLSGLIYFVLGPVQGIHGWLSGRAVQRAAAA